MCYFVVISLKHVVPYSSVVEKKFSKHKHQILLFHGQTHQELLVYERKSNLAGSTQVRARDRVGKLHVSRSQRELKRTGQMQERRDAASAFEPAL